MFVLTVYMKRQIHEVSVRIKKAIDRNSAGYLYFSTSDLISNVPMTERSLYSKMFGMFCSCFGEVYSLLFRAKLLAEWLALLEFDTFFYLYLLKIFQGIIRIKFK